ncbi:hypothetical protein DFH94DRAFT_456712 [Russula ochroleuca]|uniref:Peptidase C19 ubiquitin carboxyl-terminal hydrolase domain-containing protein n=1 Tax=Russula ochroleuca TaxID=152965 RepID=A0A9P5MVZ6_9AGAM|nr:hypothetical protein DFH94DRAFT_456712 [Russula ochroleuca]
MDAAEEENVTFLTSMMGDGDPEVARRVLRKHNGDMQKAATSILEGDTGAEDPWPADFGLTDASTITLPSTPPPSKPERDKSVIDLTGDDESVELRRALQASLSPSAYPPSSQFRPSDRAPDPNWAMVPSNVEQPSGISQDDHYLSRAIQESIRDTYNDQEGHTILTLEQLARKGNRPVAIRPSQGSLVYAALLFQGLYYVPQVRQNIAKWHPRSLASGEANSASGEELLMWTLLENYTHMDLAVIGELDLDPCLPALQLDPPGYSPASPGELSYDFLQRLTLTIETSLHRMIATEVQRWQRLFYFRYGPADAQPDKSPFDQRQDMAIVKVDIRDDDHSADLVSALSARMAHSEIPSKQLVIFEPSDVVTFQLMRHDTLPSYSRTSSLPRQPFRYPKHIYLDQYMRENVEIASAKWRQRKEIAEKIQNLNLRENALKKHQNMDISKSLQATLHYYEHVANKDTPERAAAIVRQTQKLGKIVARIENELETIQTEKDDLKDQLSRIFEGPELREHRYDLRVVFMHDGVYGRNHLYSYVNDNDTWWKTVDWVVTEVSEETVLTDPTGFHLGAGPYMLIYSRAIPEGDQEPLPWPEGVVRDVQRHNQIFLGRVAPGDTASETVGISVPSSTSVSGFTTPLEIPVTPGEAMDVSN